MESVINKEKLIKGLKAYNVPENEIKEFIKDIESDVEEAAEDKAKEFDSDNDFEKWD